MLNLPVRCPMCHQTSLVIRTGDKYYCRNPDCQFGERLPSNIGHAANAQIHRYYVRQLEEECLRARNKTVDDFLREEKDQFYG